MSISIPAEPAGQLERPRHTACRPLDLCQLSSFQRILLTTDGTVTDILQAQYWEGIRIVKLQQERMRADGVDATLDPGSEEIILRKVLLRGKVTERNYLYAESILVPSHLSPAMLRILERTDKPIGQLMIEMRMETFREILSCRLEPAWEAGQYFQLDTCAHMIARTYRIFAAGRPLMSITEKFPAHAFRD